MKFMIGECTGPKWEKRLAESGFGRMWIARGRNIYTQPGEVWGFDNGAYRDYSAGRTFDSTAFLKSLDKAVAHPHRPRLAVLPDIVAGGERSAEFSMRWRERVPDELPWYLAVQDGMTSDVLDDFGDSIVGVFLGGSDAFKAQAGYWADAARARRLRFHYGRCGTPEKMAHAMKVGADTGDSAGIMWNKERWRLAVEIIRNGPVQKNLFYN